MKVALRVHDLNYRPLPDAFEDLEHFLLSNTPTKLLDIAGVKQSTNSENMILHKVSFVADAGKVTGKQKFTFYSLVIFTSFLKFIPTRYHRRRAEHEKNNSRSHQRQ